MHLTLRQLSYFVAIVDAGTMTRAADRLGLAPTALSLQVRLMEDHLGVSLLRRHSRGVKPTSEGRELYERGRHILDLVDETERQLSPAEAPTQRRVKLGLPPSALRMIGVEAVLAGARLLDNMVVELSEGFSCDLVKRLEDGELDFALICELEARPDMRSSDLFEESLVFATAPQCARQAGSVSLVEALADELVFYGEKDVCWRLVHEAAHSAGLEVKVSHFVGSVDVIRHIVLRGIGSAIVPFGIAEEEMRRGEVVLHTINDRPIWRRMSLAWIEANENARSADSLVSFVKDIALDFHARTKPHSRLLPPQSFPASAAAS